MALVTNERKGANNGGLTAATGLAVVTIPVVLGLLVYWDLLGLWFWVDDFIWLKTPAESDAGVVFREAFAFPRGASPYWRPLVDIYFYGMFETFAFNATAYLVATLGVHVAAAVLLGFFAMRLTRSAMVAALASGLYVISPTYSTIVPSASGIGAALSGFFAVSMALLFLQWLEGRRLRWLVLSAVALAGALLSKEDAAALPAVLVLMTLAVKQPRTLRELRGASLLLLPMIGVWLVYAIPQFVAVIGSDDPSRFSFGWHGVPRLGIALSWLSLPYPLFYAEWVNASRWAALGVFTLIAVFSALRRAWLLPALYLATVAMLLPSSFLTSDFAPRWTYHASLPWAIFVAAIFVGAYRYLSSLYAPLGLAAGGVTTFALIAVLSARAIDSLAWIPPLAEDYHRIERSITTGCPDLRDGGKTYFFPLPIGGPGFSEYAVPELIQTIYPGTMVLRTGPSTLARLPAPQPADCVLSWNPRTGYTATAVDSSRTGLAFWTPAAAPNLLGDAYDVTPFNSVLEETDDGVRVASDESPFGLVIGETAPVGSRTYLASVWVRSIDGQESSVSIILAQETESGRAFSAAEFALSQDWQQIAVYHRGREAEPGTLLLSVVATLEEPLEHSFLVRDPEIKLFTVQTPLQ